MPANRAQYAQLVNVSVASNAVTSIPVLQVALTENVTFLNFLIILDLQKRSNRLLSGLLLW